MKKISLLPVLLIAAILLAVGCSQKSATAPANTKPNNLTILCNDDGNGTGKVLSALRVTVTYFDPFFYTDQGYPGFYIGVSMTCKLTVKNTSDTAFNCLTISGEHEYYDTGVCERWWYPYPREADYTKGEALPGASGSTWNCVNIAPHGEVDLTYTYLAPLETCSGLDQTHVLITSNCEMVILNSPEAGIFCPPPPAKK